MATTTKDKILAAAKELFNQRGYNDVSMRDVAEALGISVGNLTYHYARKENLVEAVVLWQHQNYKKTAPARSLDGLQRFFARILRHQQENNYYFKNYMQLAQVCPAVYKIQLGVMRDFLQTLRASFLTLQHAGLLEGEELPGQYERLASALRVVSLFGEAEGDERLLSLWSLIYPLLTRKGKRTWQSEIAPQLGGTQ